MRSLWRKSGIIATWYIDPNPKKGKLIQKNKPILSLDLTETTEIRNIFTLYIDNKG